MLSPTLGVDPGHRSTAVRGVATQSTLIVNTSSKMYCRVLPRASGHHGRVFAGVVRPWERVTRGDHGGHRGPSTLVAMRVERVGSGRLHWLDPRVALALWPFRGPLRTFPLPYTLTAGLNHRENLFCHPHGIRRNDTVGPLGACLRRRERPG